MANAQDAIKSARAYLNDVNGITWSDSVLMPLLQEAFGELQLNLATHRIPVIKAQVDISVPTGTTVLPNLPTNIVSPISLYEKDPTATDDFYDQMLQVTFLPNDSPNAFLGVWAWIGQRVLLLGATEDRQVRFQYEGYLTVPTVLTDPLGFIFAERFLGPRIASIALHSVGQTSRAMAVSRAADINLFQVMQYNTTSDQRPVRRRRYRSDKNTGIPDGLPGQVF